MIAHRMPSFLAGRQNLMATITKRVDGFVQHKEIIGGMGIMTGYTAVTEDNFMDIWYGVVFIHQALFVIMTTKANFEGRFSPEQIFIVTPMRIMA